MNNKNDDDEYKEKNLQHLNGNETGTSKTKVEEAYIKRLESMNSQKKS